MFLGCYIVIFSDINEHDAQKMHQGSHCRLLVTVGEARERFLD